MRPGFRAWFRSCRCRWNWTEERRKARTIQCLVSITHTRAAGKGIPKATRTRIVPLRIRQSRVSSGHGYLNPHYLNWRHKGSPFVWLRDNWSAFLERHHYHRPHLGSRLMQPPLVSNSFVSKGLSEICEWSIVCLPDVIEVDKVKAEFKDGVLNLHLPKSEKAKPKAIEVKMA